MQVIFPSLAENVPDYYQMVDMTPTGLSANLNHGSFRAPEVFLCFRRGRDRPPLLDIGILYEGKEKLMPDSQVSLRSKSTGVEIVRRSPLCFMHPCIGVFVYLLKIIQLVSSQS